MHSNEQAQPIRKRTSSFQRSYLHDVTRLYRERIRHIISIAMVLVLVTAFANQISFKNVELVEHLASKQPFGFAEQLN
jgi:hypothetical protein